MNQVTDKFKRVKYLRALEKFAKSAINVLKRDDFDETEFRQRVEKNAKVIEKIEAVYLGNSDIDEVNDKKIKEYYSDIISLFEAIKKELNDLQITDDNS